MLLFRCSVTHLAAHPRLVMWWRNCACSGDAAVWGSRDGRYRADPRAGPQRRAPRPAGRLRGDGADPGVQQVGTGATPCLVPPPGPNGSQRACRNPILLLDEVKAYLSSDSLRHWLLAAAGRTPRRPRCACWRSERLCLLSTAPAEQHFTPLPRFAGKPCTCPTWWMYSTRAPHPTASASPQQLTVVLGNLCITSITSLSTCPERWPPCSVLKGPLVQRCAGWQWCGGVGPAGDWRDGAGAAAGHRGRHPLGAGRPQWPCPGEMTQGSGFCSESFQNRLLLESRTSVRVAYWSKLLQDSVLHALGLMIDMPPARGWHDGVS
jgi:hypothetical protein